MPAPLTILRTAVVDHLQADTALMALLPAPKKIYRWRRAVQGDLPQVRYLDFGAYQYVGQVATAPRLAVRTFSFDVVAADVDAAEEIAHLLALRLTQVHMTVPAGARVEGVSLVADRDDPEADGEWVRRILDFEFRAYLTP